MPYARPRPVVRRRRPHRRRAARVPRNPFRTVARTRAPFRGGNSFPFGQAFSTTLRYTTVLYLDAGAFAYKSHFLSLNSLFDPDNSAVGNKRGLGFAELSALYSQYRVNAAKIAIKAINTTVRPLIVGLVTGTDTSQMTYSAADELLAAPSCKHIILAPNTLSRPKALTAYAKVHNVMGLTKAQYQTDVEYAADVTANPTEEALFGINIIDPSTTIGPTVTLFVDIVQYCTFTHRKPIALSAAP